MVGNLKSHLANILVLLLAWVSVVFIITVFALLGHAVIILIKALEGSFWSYFWTILGVILIPPVFLWTVWLRKYPS